MARIKNCGFELDTTTAGVEISTPAAAISISSAHTVGVSSFSLLLNTSAQASLNKMLIFSANQTTSSGYYRTWIYVVSYPTALCNIMAFLNTVGTTLCAIRMNTDGTLQLTQANGTTQIGSSSVAVALNTWTYVELNLNAVASGTSTCAARLNGTQFASGNNASGNTGQWSMVSFGPNASNTVQLYYDDIAINDNTTSFNNSWPGNSNLAIARPNAAGDSNTWLTKAGGAGGTTNYQAVNEVPPDDATTYNQATTVGASDLYAVSATSIPAGSTINNVSVSARITNLTGASNTSAVQYQIEKQSAGTVTKGTALVPNEITWGTDNGTGSNSAWTSPLVMANDPDSNPWTLTTIGSMQIGIYLSAFLTDAVAVSNLWAYIDYTPSSGHLLPLLGVGT